MSSPLSSNSSTLPVSKALLSLFLNLDKAATSFLVRGLILFFLFGAGIFVVVYFLITKFYCLLLVYTPINSQCFHGKTMIPQKSAK